MHERAEQDIIIQPGMIEYMPLSNHRLLQICNPTWSSNLVLFILSCLMPILGYGTRHQATEDVCLTRTEHTIGASLLSSSDLYK